MTTLRMIPDHLLLTWDSQVVQYPKTGDPGIGYFRGDLGEYYPGQWVNCLLYRDAEGHVIGILNHYPFTSVWERSGNVNIWVHPDHQRQGIGTALMAVADTRWGPFSPRNWSFTKAGLSFARKLGLV